MPKIETGYPSIDKTHEKSENYFNRKPLIPSISIYNAIKLISTLYRNDSAIDCLELNLSYEELLNNAVIISKGFKELGIKHGDIIVISMPNFSQAVASYLAANRIGAVTTFLNPFASIEEVKEYLNLFESPLFINFDKDNEYNQSIKKIQKLDKLLLYQKKI